MDSTYETSRDWETTNALRNLEWRVERLERQNELLTQRIKAEMWSEIWFERLKGATIVMAAIAVIVWARLILAG